MIRMRPGRVVGVVEERPGVSEVLVEVEGRVERAVNYDHVTGSVAVGDRVVLNTGAVALELGTGGVHFVMVNLARLEHDGPKAGHIMKLRYTPYQVPVLAVEEDASPHAERLRDSAGLDGLPVVAGSLHSMLGPFAAAVGELAPELKVVYLMTDGGALPLAFSRLAGRLKEAGLVHATVTCGHAFGGDFEAVNVYSGMLAAREAAGADIILAAMGPGIVGTAQAFGFTGIEQGELVNAAGVLGGVPIAIPRISFADPRERHRGVSHHTLTALGKVALAPALVALPRLDDAHALAALEAQLSAAGVSARHQVVIADGSAALSGLERHGLNVTTMGRDRHATPEFFLACGAAARLAVDVRSRCLQRPRRS
ncbi:MAG: DUF3866 family protein [Bacillota bacterium]